MLKHVKPFIDSSGLEFEIIQTFAAHQPIFKTTQEVTASSRTGVGLLW